jgi:hypothetical protein
MSCGLAVWFFAAASYYCCCKRSLRVIGKFSLTVALLVYPMTAKNAIEMLYCSSARITQSQLSSVDGGDAYVDSSADATQLVTVPLLASDSYFVCFQVRAACGQQR